MKRIAILALALALAIASSAQNGLNTPFSQYGLGMSSLPYNVPMAAMRGGAVYTLAQNNIVNPFNPASLAAVQTESFVFDMGFAFQLTTQKDPQTSLFDADGTLGYLSLAMPITKWWKTGLSLLPQSDVSYLSVSEQPLMHPGIDTAIGTAKTTYEGNGGVSRLIWGHGFNLWKDRLSVGFNVNLLYGAISRGIDYDFTVADSLPQYMNARRQKTTLMRNVTFDAGLQYFQPLGKDYQLGIGITCAPPRTLSVKDNALAFTYVTYSSSDYLRDTIFPDRDSLSEYTSLMRMPLQLGLGLSLQKNNAWRIAVDGSYAQWSGAKYEDRYDLLGNGHALQYDANLRGALGLQFLGDPGATHYARRITYSAGLHYESGKLRLALDQEHPDAVQRLDEWGIGVGVTLPMRKGKSLLSLSANYSSFGTADLLRHNAVTFGISVSSADSWFVKRKYN